jgi:radical SAM protein with 4Fe4S-binding SPASM domain
MNKCPAAFNQLYLHSSGKVYPCSFLQNDPRFELGSLSSKTLDDIWVSDELKRFREIQVKQDESSRCSSNQKKYLCDKLNTRSYFNNDDLKLKRIDIMLDSFCNLICIMCTNIYDETGGFKLPFFWENNDLLISSLKEIELVGGEPLISPYFFKLVDKVLMTKNDCEWKVTTNANYPITARLKETLDKLNFSTFAISLDSLSKNTFETIRKNSSHELVMSNIDKFSTFIPNLSINMVVQQLNHSELFEMYQWSKDKGLKFYPILLTHPETHSLLNLPEIELLKITKDLIANNQKIKSLEIFFLIRKIINNSSLKFNIDAIASYQEHLLDLPKVLDE